MSFVCAWESLHPFAIKLFTKLKLHAFSQTNCQSRFLKINIAYTSFYVSCECVVFSGACVLGHMRACLCLCFCVNACEFMSGVAHSNSYFR